MNRSVLPALLVAVSAGLAHAEPPRRPADFRPFHYKFSPEELRQRFTKPMTERAARDYDALMKVVEEGPYKPTWQSLDSHPLPEWYEDAKFGVMLNWGIYSVPSWDFRRQGAMYPDAYPAWMHFRPEHLEYHKRTWGTDFRYDDFIPLFTAENYDPAAIVRLVKEAGGHYVIPFVKHHDAMCHWDCSFTHRTTLKMGPKRDLYAPLVEACRQQGLKCGVYFSLEEYAYPAIDADDQLFARLFYSYHALDEWVPLSPTHRGRVAGQIPVRDYVHDYLVPQFKELIDRFDPDTVWFDGQWTRPADYYKSREMIAYFYNRAEGRKPVLCGDRFGAKTRGKHGDVYSSEFADLKESQLAHKWEEVRTISQSFAYNHEDTENDVLSPTELVHLLVEIVSHNGNLTLIVAPDHTGAIPELQASRLKALGQWLGTNGAAIYASRPLPPYKEGDVRFTQSKDGGIVYAICLKWPGDRLVSRAVRPAPGSTITMLGAEQPLDWTQNGEQLEIEIPADLQDNRPCQHAWVLRIRPGS
jgi:alpha-L-fucosidase